METKKQTILDSISNAIRYFSDLIYGQDLPLGEEILQALSKAKRSIKHNWKEG